MIAVARREQGHVVAAGNPLQLSDVATATFRERASELTGYDVSDAGNVRWLN